MTETYQPVTGDEIVDLAEESARAHMRSNKARQASSEANDEYVVASEAAREAEHKLQEAIQRLKEDALDRVNP